MNDAQKRKKRNILVCWSIDHKSSRDGILLGFGFGSWFVPQNEFQCSVRMNINQFIKMKKEAKERMIKQRQWYANYKDQAKMIIIFGVWSLLIFSFFLSLTLVCLRFDHEQSKLIERRKCCLTKILHKRSNSSIKFIWSGETSTSAVFKCSVKWADDQLFGQKEEVKSSERQQSHLNNYYTLHTERKKRFESSDKLKRTWKIICNN